MTIISIVVCPHINTSNWLKSIVEDNRSISIPFVAKCIA